jgi:hypothetical protein
MSTMSEHTETNVIRPLRVIEREIKELFDRADQAADDAAQPFYRKIAPLLIEAKEGYFAGETAKFFDWAQRKFGKSHDSIRTYIALGTSKRSSSFKNLEEFTYTPKKQGGLGKTPYDSRIRRDWTVPVDEVAERARREAFRLAQEESLTRAQEREAERRLAHRLIDIGYKVLAKELHPDKMRGDKDAFQRLARVRDKLKHCI